MTKPQLQEDEARKILATAAQLFWGGWRADPACVGNLRGDGGGGMLVDADCWLAISAMQACGVQASIYKPPGALFDPMCFGLAEYFLPGGARDEVKRELALAIQNAVEEFCEMEAAGLNPKAGRPQ